MKLIIAILIFLIWLQLDTANKELKVQSDILLDVYQYQRI